ncbi:uncharacterized protein LOC128212544 [Mya arenaria]|uniref:uncharacterized protein LOC128210225 n=1 Tax=Mya arenaria TaxID=6604 RepID=UPI0022DF13DF|nr:uncharacterized protein LOC128210225 [Mya arenaria]XP_052773997.1 uncharacterized protein LOC128212544 [Mya arenaria]
MCRYTFCRMKSFLLVTTCVVMLAVAEATVCKVNSECASSQCCYIKPEFEVVSKKRQSLLPLPATGQHDTGVCENYRPEHDLCSPLETANGHCGCLVGTSCQFVPAPSTTTLTSLVQGRKRKIYYPGPGSYQCVAA